MTGLPPPNPLLSSLEMEKKRRRAHEQEMPEPEHPSKVPVSVLIAVFFLSSGAQARAHHLTGKEKGTFV